MKYLKNLGIFSVVIAVVACSILAQTAETAHAATTSNNQPAVEDEVTFNAASADTSAQVSLYIAGITLDRASYNAGETINGSFVLENHSAFAVTGLSFQVLIGAEYRELAPNVKSAGSILDFSPRQGSISIAKGGSVTVPFTYVIPAFVSGNKLAVHINALSESGNLITWQDSGYFSIKKGTAGVLIKSASIVLSNGEAFELGEGPTIYKDKEPKNASVTLSISNLSAAAVTIVPEINVYRQSGMQEIQKSASAPFDLKAKETRNVSIALPTLSYEPGVYLADIILKDANGQQLESMIEARYIIGGDIATVQSISADKETLAKGEAFTLSALLTGTAPDMSELRNGVRPSGDSNKTGSVKIALYNERNQPVASAEEPFALAGNTVIKKDLEALAPAKALRAEVFVYDDAGALLLNYKKNLSADYDAEALEAAKTSLNPFSNPLPAILVIALVLIILCIIIYMIRRKKVFLGGTMMLLFLCAVAIPSAVFAVDCAIRITPSTPYNYQIYSPGEAFYATGSVGYTACSNTTSYVDVRVVSSWGERAILGVIDTSGGYEAVSHGFYPHSTTFIAGPFHAPTTPGTYWLHYISRNKATTICDTSDDAWIYIVVPAAAAVNPTTTTGGDTSTTGTSTVSCGTQNNTPVANGRNINDATSGLCASGSSLYGRTSLGLDTSSWRWMCSKGSESSFCSATCATGTLYCPATGVCSADCVDWCPDYIPGNPVGNQTVRGLYTIDSTGLCSGANIIEDFHLSSSFTDSSGKCKALWTLNNITDATNMTCAINGTPVSCINTTGFGTEPGTAKLEVTVTVASSTITDSEELRCTQNPAVIEI